MDSWLYQVWSGPGFSLLALPLAMCLVMRRKKECRREPPESEREPTPEDRRRAREAAWEALQFSERVMRSVGVEPAPFRPQAHLPSCRCEDCPPLDAQTLDKHQDTGVKSPSMSAMTSDWSREIDDKLRSLPPQTYRQWARDNPDEAAALEGRTGFSPSPQAARLKTAQRRLSGVIAQARGSELAREDASRLYMSMDPADCLHLLKEPVVPFGETEPVAFLCPACGTALPLKEGK